MKDDTPKLQYKPSAPVKLKDYPASRRFVSYDLMKVFGFIPETVIIAKIEGSNNKVGLLAVMTKEEIEKDKKRKEEEKKMLKKALEGAQNKLKEQETNPNAK